jgi:hypothetical protein
MSTSIHEYLDEVIEGIVDELDQANELVQIAQDATLNEPLRRDAIRRLEEMGRVDELALLAHPSTGHCALWPEAIAALERLGRANELLQLAKDHAERDEVRIEATAALVHSAPKTHFTPLLHKEVGPLLIEWSHDEARIW